MSASSDNTDRMICDLKDAIKEWSMCELNLDGFFEQVAEDKAVGINCGPAPDVEFTTIKVCRTCHRRVYGHLIFSKNVCHYCGHYEKYSQDIVDEVPVIQSQAPEYGEIYDPEGVVNEKPLERISLPVPPKVGKELSHGKKLEFQERKYDPYPEQDREPVNWGFWLTVSGTAISFISALYWVVSSLSSAL